MSDPAGWFDGGEHVLPVRVYYEDTDAGGVIYHTNYLKYFERARTEILRHHGIVQAALWDQAGAGFALRRASIEFLAPGRLDDLLEVRTRVTGQSAASVGFTQRALRDGRLLASAEVLVVHISTAGRPLRLPAALRELVAALCSQNSDTMVRDKQIGMDRWQTQS